MRYSASAGEVRLSPGQGIGTYNSSALEGRERCQIFLLIIQYNDKTSDYKYNIDQCCKHRNIWIDTTFLDFD